MQAIRACDGEDNAINGGEKMSLRETIECGAVIIICSFVGHIIGVVACKIIAS